MQIKHAVGQMKPFALFFQAGELLQVRTLWSEAEKPKMQTAGIGFSIGKRVSLNRLLYLLETEEEDVGFNPVAILDCSGYLPGEF